MHVSQRQPPPPPPHLLLRGCPNAREDAAAGYGHLCLSTVFSGFLRTHAAHFWSYGTIELFCWPSHFASMGCCKLFGFLDVLGPALLIFCVLVWRPSGIFPLEPLAGRPAQKRFGLSRDRIPHGVHGAGVARGIAHGAVCLAAGRGALGRKRRICMKHAEEARAART